MSFLHYQLNLHHGQAVKVDLTGHASNVFLVDASNFAAFRARRRFQYFGGKAIRSPVILRPPHGGCWNLVVEPVSGQVTSKVTVLN